MQNLRTCPKCGYTEEQPVFNPSKKIKDMLNARGVVVRKSLKNILRLTKNYSPFTPRELFNFLKKIEDVPDNILKFALNQYYVQGYFETKNIHYLGAVIANFDKNQERIRSVERKIYGAKPPRREIPNG